MRLRLLVPRSGRGRGLGGLALAAAAVALVVVLARQDGEQPRERPPAPTPTPTATPTPTPTPAPLDVSGTGPSLAVGITEPNPNLFATADVLQPPPGWARWRNQLVRIRPALYRLVVEWNKIQPSTGAPADLAALTSGCMRDKQPCAPYLGVHDQLRALASRQQKDPGAWQALVVFTGTPEWAAAPPDGCREETGAGAPRELAAYRALVRGVLDLAEELGAELRYVSPWNEPNHPYFLSPQRSACDPGARSRAVAPYAALARAARAELGPDQQLVLGEMAGILEPTSRATSVPEMIRGLLRGLVCAAPVWSQHAYIGGTDPVAAVKRALAARRCPREHAIWITETGVGPAPGGFSLARGITSERQGCRLLHQRLAAWYEDPRVTVAAQYTMREDDLFPTGLVTTDLARSRPALGEWQAWGARARLGDPPPAMACPDGG
jgi:hypothetical protein